MSWFGRQLNKLFAPRDFTPTYTPSGSMTFTSVTTTAAKESLKSDNVAHICVVATGTVGGTPSHTISIRGFGYTPGFVNQPLACFVTEGGWNKSGAAYFEDANTIRVRKRDASNFVAGAVIISVGGDYYL